MTPIPENPEALTSSKTSANPIIAFLSTRTGISTALLSAVLPVVVGFAVDRIRAAHHYDRGWSAFEETLREGTAELDGKIVEILDTADQEAKIREAEIDARAAGYAEAAETFTNVLDRNNENHANALRDLNRRQYTQEERDWRARPVPNATRLRFKHIETTRSDGDHRDERPETENLAGPPLSPKPNPTP